MVLPLIRVAEPFLFHYFVNVAIFYYSCAKELI